MSAFKPGDRVRWEYLGKRGDVGTVVKVTRRKLAIGGSTQIVKVCWDSNKYCGSVESRVLKKEPRR